MYRERELEFVKSVNTTASYSGWLELNITDCLPSWLAFPESNKGLYLSVHPADKPGKKKKSVFARFLAKTPIKIPNLNSKRVYIIKINSDKNKMRKINLLLLTSLFLNNRFFF